MDVILSHAKFFSCLEYDLCVENSQERGCVERQPLVNCVCVVGGVEGAAIRESVSVATWRFHAFQTLEK